MPEDKKNPNNSEMLIKLDIHMNSIEEKFDDLRVTLDQIKKSLFGNGSPGITERVRNIEKRNKFTSKILWTTLTMAFGSLVTVMTKIFFPHA